MTDHDVLFGFRLQLFDLAACTSVTHACRVFNVHRSTYYAWKQKVDRHGLEVVRPRERRRPRMPNQLSPRTRQPSHIRSRPLTSLPTGPPGAAAPSPGAGGLRRPPRSTAPRSGGGGADSSGGRQPQAVGTRRGQPGCGS
jgi:hypothetical protein